MRRGLSLAWDEECVDNPSCNNSVLVVHTHTQRTTHNALTAPGSCLNHVDHTVCIPLGMGGYNYAQFVPVCDSLVTI